MIDRSIIDDCVHCGFCLPSCPTYGIWQEEMDSPRGRIVLIKALAEGEAPSAELAEHLDRCLGCMACTTACPSGVRYDELLVQARAELPSSRRRRLLLAALTRPGLLRATVPLLPLTRRLPGVGRLAPRADRTRVPQRVPARGPRRGRAGLLLGCVQRAFFGRVNRAAADALAAEGWEVVAPPRPRCCGSLHLHTGHAGEAAALAAATARAFAGCDVIVTTAAGCGSGLKEQGISGVRDVHEVLADAPRAPRAALALRVAYHDACHLGHAQNVRVQPRAVLRSIPGLELVEPAGQGDCCGSAGIYNLTHPGAAGRLGRERAAALAGLGADVVAAANPGCALQLEAHGSGRVVHPVELLAASIRAAQRQAGRVEGGPRA